MNVLITRAQEDGGGAKTYLAARGVSVIHIPLIRIEPAFRTPPDGIFDALIVTSIHGAPYIRNIPGFESVPVYAVGERTAEAVRQIGARFIRIGDGTAASLVRMILAESTPEKRFLHVTGIDHKSEPGESLIKSGFSYHCWTAYRAAEVKPAPESLRKALKAGNVHVALHYSRRSVILLTQRVVEEKLLDHLKMLYHVFISEDARKGAVWEGTSWLDEKHVFIAEKPEENAMLTACERALALALKQHNT